MRPNDRSIWHLLAWLFRPRAHRQHAREMQELKLMLAFEERVRQEGYRPVLGCLPPFDRPIEAIRISWPEPKFIRLSDQRPEFNLAGLYWREP